MHLLLLQEKFQQKLLSVIRLKYADDKKTQGYAERMEKLYLMRQPLRQIDQVVKDGMVKGREEVKHFMII